MENRVCNAKYIKNLIDNKLIYKRRKDPSTLEIFKIVLLKLK